jgi:hypothetical protein
MGSIRWQSTQVTAKNSIKIKSFCFGTKTFWGVRVEGITVGMAVAAIGVREAGGVTPGFSRGSRQAVTNTVIKSRKMQRFNITKSQSGNLQVLLSAHIVVQKTYL